MCLRGSQREHPSWIKSKIFPRGFKTSFVDFGGLVTSVAQVDYRRQYSPRRVNDFRLIESTRMETHRLAQQDDGFDDVQIAKLKDGTELPQEVLPILHDAVVATRQCQGAIFLSDTTIHDIFSRMPIEFS